MPSRRAFYFVTSVVCLLISAGLYASATANYPPPWNNPRAEAPLPSRSSALRVLTNEPGAEVKIRVRFNLFRAETMTGFTEITFLNVRDRVNFRWALIGTGSMRFRARMIPVTNGNPQATFDALPDFQDAYVDTAPTSWTVSGHSRLPERRRTQQEDRTQRPGGGFGYIWRTRAGSVGREQWVGFDRR